MNIKKEESDIATFCADVADILQNKKVEQMKKYPHHRNISTHFHSVYVAYICHKTAKKLNMQTRELTRAAVLHDFYLYDWHTEKHEEKHAWYHPKKAYENAVKYVEPLTKKQKDMILSHMWPLHPAPPKSPEGFILTFADKHCANMDLLFSSKSFIPVYDEILRRTEKNEDDM